MRVLFDQGVPAPLRRALVAHTVSTAYELGWSEIQNGERLSQAESQGFEVLVTTDPNLRYQQNLAARTITIVVFLTTNSPRLRSEQGRIARIIDAVSACACIEVRVA